MPSTTREWERWNEQYRLEVADWLYGHLGNDGQKPASAASPDKRQSLERKGVNLSGVKDLLNRAYVESTDGQSFVDNVRKYGLALEAGQKTGVYVVQLAEVDVGSVDRLLKLKRAEVSKLLSNVNFKNKEISNDATSGNGTTRKSDLQESANRRGKTESAARSTIGRSERKQRESAPEHARNLRGPIELKQDIARQSGQTSQQIGRSGVQLAQEKIAAAALSKIEISSIMQSHINFINERKLRAEKERPEIWQQSLFDRIRQRFASAFLRLKECLEMMKLCSDDNLKRFSEAEKQRLKEPLVTRVQPDRVYSSSIPKM